MNYLTAVVRLPVQLIWAWPGSTTPSQLVSPVVKPQLTLPILLWLLTLLIITTGNLQTWNCRSIFIRLIFFVFVIWTKIWIGNFSHTSASIVQQKKSRAICRLREKITRPKFPHVSVNFVYTVKSTSFKTQLVDLTGCLLCLTYSRTSKYKDKILILPNT